MQREETIWLCIYLPLTWAVELSHGMMNTVVGPSQIYLAQNVGIGIDRINFLWSFGFFGYLFGSFFTSAILKSYLKQTWMKLAVMWFCSFFGGLFMIALPLTDNQWVLFAARFLQFVCIGGLCTADNSLLVFMLGPKRSRPLTLALHATIGMGFLLATFLVKPFLPAVTGDSCGKEVSAGADSGTAEEELPDTSRIRYPFLVVGGWSVLSSLGFLLLAAVPARLAMPVFTPAGAGVGVRGDKAELFPTAASRTAFLSLIFVYFALTCGTERIFQPMMYTFGLCGPLGLEPGRAVVTDNTYNGGFMAGRVASIALGAYVEPTKMIACSLLMCTITAGVLSLVSGFSVLGLYLGTFVMGFFVAWQFGSAVNWTAKKVDVTGKISSVFFLGCGVGSTVSPVAAGYLFTSHLGHMSIMYLTVVCQAALCGVFALVHVMTRVWSRRRRRAAAAAAAEGGDIAMQ